MKLHRKYHTTQLRDEYGPPPYYWQRDPELTVRRAFLPWHRSRLNARRKRNRKLAVKTVLRKRPTARNQKYQIAKLARSVKRNAAKISFNTARVKFLQVGKNQFSAHYMTVPLVLPKDAGSGSASSTIWGLMWEQDPVKVDHVEAARKCHIHGGWLRYNIDPHTEDQLINYMVCVLQPKTKSIYNETNGLASLVQGRDYQVLNANEHGTDWMINTNRFNIHYLRRHRTADTYSANNLPKWTAGGLYHCNLNWKAGKGEDKWTSIENADVPINKQRFMVVFNNNSAVDVQYPQICWSFQTVGTINYN